MMIKKILLRIPCITLIIHISHGNILSQISEWNTGVYFPNGSPNLTRELIYDNVKNYTFTPRFLKIKSEMQPKGNIYISLYKNITKINFRIYEEHFSDYPNYKFNVNSNRMEKCSTLNDCAPLSLCQPANGEEVLNNNTVFLSWELIEKSNGFNLTILFQYKHRLVKCMDQNAIKIKQISLEGEESQDVQSTSLFYKYTEKVVDTTAVNFTLSNSSVAIYATHARHCEFVFNLSCNEQSGNTLQLNTTFQFAGKDVFNTEVNFLGWQKTIISASSTNSTLCTLEINTVNKTIDIEDENSIINKYWSIAFIDPTVELVLPKIKEDENETNSSTGSSITEQPNHKQTSTGHPNSEQPQESDIGSGDRRENKWQKNNATQPSGCGAFQSLFGPVDNCNVTQTQEESEEEACPIQIFVIVQACCALLFVVLFGVPMLQKFHSKCKRQ